MAAVDGDRPVDLADDRRLADARVARDQHGLCRSAYRAIERVEQRADLGLSAVQPVRELQPCGHVVLADHEALDPTLRLELAAAALEIDLDPGRGLVALLGRLREQLHHDVADDIGDRRIDVIDPARLLREVRVDQRERVVALERESSGQELVQRDAECVEVAARVDRPVEAPGLFGRHVGQ
jgi:hypothetical protein